MNAGRLLVAILTEPSRAAGLGGAEWQALLTAARAESLLGSLALRLDRATVPPTVAAVLEDAIMVAEQARRAALWEAEMARRALAETGVPLILLKGTAYVAAGLAAGVGRSIGDLDILVPRDALGRVEAALLAAHWEWVKEDPYDAAYYRRWMHELPPLIHRDRDRMIDVHHTILPLTARPTPDAEALIAARVELGRGLAILSPVDMLIHAATHLFADGDLAGGLRNLWDIDRLLREFGEQPGFWTRLAERSALHELRPAVARALRLARALYATPVEAGLAGTARASDALFIRRLLARDGWGRELAKPLRLAFYVRSHWLRMPPLMLARHLAIKARRRRPITPPVRTD